MYFAIAVGLVAEQCHGLYYKTRSTWNASPPKTPPRPFTVPATLVVLRPTGTSECNVGSCARIVKEIQNDDMKNKGLDDIGSKYAKTAETYLYYESLIKITSVKKFALIEFYGYALLNLSLLDLPLFSLSYLNYAIIFFSKSSNLFLKIQIKGEII